MPFDNLLIPILEQKGHFCLFLCFSSTLIILALTVFPYLGPNLPDAFAFFVLVAIFIKWGCADLNRGRQVPNLKGYQATPQPLKTKEI